ncbi:hypothetical protein [Lachnobacterium bovis]|uniref:hypothetical protein n=1 Tax=Lachnobacterium bovis TaxID=140626 RepID=UPI0004869B5D|nr:hypothetical protein [Lachnobacterium bovis]
MREIKIGDKHTFIDWGLVLTKRPEIGAPSVKTNLIDIPGLDGQLDLSEAVTNHPTYSTRPAKFTFITLEDRDSWFNLSSDIMDYLHGNVLTCVLDEDPEYYYKGRFTLSAFDINNDKKSAKVEISGTLEPFKCCRASTCDPWLWDTFRFDTGVIKPSEYLKQEVHYERVFKIKGHNRLAVVRIDTTDEIDLTCNSDKYHLNQGNNILELDLKDGNNLLIFNGYSTVTIDYVERRL